MPREQLDVVPPKWARAHRSSAAAMLAAEAKALRELRAAIRRAIEHAVAAIAVGRTRAHASAVIRDAARALTAEIASAVFLARKAARDASIGQLGSALALAEQDLRRLGYEESLATPDQSDGAEDDAHADAAGRSYASAWIAVTLRIVAKWADGGEEGGLARLISQTEAQLDYRTRRIATTEVAQAYNDEQDEGIGWVAEQYRAAPWIVALLKRWDATLDAKVCQVCRDHDGELAIPGSTWSEDDEPGFVHSFCRCISAPIFIPARAPRAAAAGEYTDDDDEAA